MCPGKVSCCIPHIVISFIGQVETWLIFVRILRSLQVSPRSCRTYRAWSCYWGKKQVWINSVLKKKPLETSVFFWCLTLHGVCCMCLYAYLFVLEGLHQLRYPTEGHGEGQMGASVAVRYLDTLVAKISLPLCVTTDFILAKDVRYQVSCIKAREGK